MVQKLLKNRPRNATVIVENKGAWHFFQLWFRYQPVLTEVNECMLLESAAVCNVSCSAFVCSEKVALQLNYMQLSS